MKNVKFLLLFLCLISPVFAEEAKESSKEEAKHIMDNVYVSFTKIIPYVYSDEKKIESLKNDGGAKNDLVKNLTDISGFFKSARHVEYFQRPGFRPSLETINKHIEDTLNSVKNNNFSFAQKRLKALTSLCISCHSQLSESASENVFGNAIKKAKKENFESDFAYGNYLFLVRRFSESENSFELAIKNALKTHNDSELYPSMRRILSLHTKIEFNAKAAQDFISKLQKEGELPTLALEQVMTWNKSMKKWKNFNPKKINSIDSFIRTNLSPLEFNKSKMMSGENDITLLIASGVLSKFLNDYPKSKNVPEILYWLSIAERRLSNSFFFSLSDLYLKDCIRLYPKSAVAKKCYKEYADNIEFGYSGSSGTDIPAEEKQELEALKSYLK